MPFAGDCGPPAQTPHRFALRPPLLRQSDELHVASSQRRQIEAVGLHDASLGVAPAIALAVRAVLHQPSYKRGFAMQAPLAILAGSSA
jgi:hypothetical protein